MIHKILRTGLIAIVLLMSSYGFSQETVTDSYEVRDFETWSSIRLKYKANEKWNMGLQAQLRLDANSSEVKAYFGQYNLGYSFSKHFQLAGGLRYIKYNDNSGNVQGYEDYFRYHLDAIFKHKADRFNFKYRLRYQNRNELGVEDDAVRYLRLKAGLGYNIKNWKLDPEVSGELFNSVGTDNDELKGFRLTIGTSYKVHKSGKIGAFYRYEKELNETWPKSVNIVGFKYTYTLK